MPFLYGANLGALAAHSAINRYSHVIRPHTGGIHAATARSHTQRNWRCELIMLGEPNPTAPAKAVQEHRPLLIPDCGAQPNMDRPPQSLCAWRVTSAGARWITTASAGRCQQRQRASAIFAGQGIGTAHVPRRISESRQTALVLVATGKGAFEILRKYRGWNRRCPYEGASPLCQAVVWQGQCRRRVCSRAPTSQHQRVQCQPTCHHGRSLHPKGICGSAPASQEAAQGRLAILSTSKPSISPICAMAICS